MTMREFGFKNVSIENVFDVDPAASLGVTIDVESGITRGAGAADWIRDVTAIELDGRVAFEVCKAFAFARGGLCYAYWYQPLLTTTANDLLRVANFATVEACRERKIVKRTLGQRVVGLIALAAIPKSDEGAWRTLGEQRGKLAHPSAVTTYGFASALRLLKTVARLIDRIEWNDVRD